MDDDYSKYKLNDKKHDEIFKAIQDYSFDGINPVDNPITVILGGQPGAGKGTLIEIAMKEIDEPIIINGDEFRKFHSQSEEIFKNHNEDYARYTDPDVREWARKIFDKAIDGKYNIIFEGTMRTNQICETIKRLKAQVYNINIKVIAVHEFESRLGIYQRYEKQIQLVGNGRFVPRSSHDEAYSGMLLTLNQIENEKLFDTLQVYDRNGQVIYQNNGDNQKLEACNSVIRERNKEWNEEKRRSYIITINKVIESMEKRNEKLEIIKEVNQLKEAVIKKFYSGLEKGI